MSTTNILDLNNRIDELEKNSGGGGSADSAKRSDIATEFNTTTAYTAGCYVYHEGKLYQFNADHAAGAWDPTDVVEANVTDQIVSNKSAIDGLTASDIAYDNTDSGLTATHVQGAVDEIVANMGNMRMLKLWQNPNTTSDFASQNVTISSSDYDILVAICYTSTGGGFSLANISLKGSGFILSYFSGSATYTRQCDRVSDTQYTIGDCRSGGTTSNNILIPCIIYGIKLI